MSFLESEAHRLGRGDFELSPMYCVYRAWEEKALRRVRSHGVNRMDAGGLPHDVLAVVRDHGIVPRSVYTGLRDGDTAHDHAELDEAVIGMIDGVIKAGNDRPLHVRWVDGRFEARWLKALQGTLDAYLGAPPDTFEFDGRTMTPRQFTDDVLRLPLDDYLEITAYSRLPFYAQGYLLLPDNWRHEPTWNVPLEDFVRIVEYALSHDASLIFGINKSTEENNSPDDFLLGHDERAGVHTTQDVRDTLLENGRTDDWHVVHAIGLARDASGRRFYWVKDSNTPAGQPAVAAYNKNFLSEEFLRSRVLYIMVHKDALPEDIRTRLPLPPPPRPR